MDDYAEFYEGAGEGGAGRSRRRGPNLPPWMPEPPELVKRLHNEALERVVEPGLVMVRFALMQAEERVRDLEGMVRELRYPKE